MGFARNEWPSISQSSFCPSASVTKAVRKMIGVRHNLGSFSIRAATFAPSISGMTMSSKITSGRKSRAV